VQGIGNATQVTAGDRHTCALLSTDHIDCWGENRYGELGDGTYSSSDMPVEAQGIGNATQVTAGALYACAVLVSGHIDCWGENDSGQLGNGTNGNSDTPVEAQGVSNATQVAAGQWLTCVLLSNARVDCWGENGSGELEVQGIRSATQVTAGGSHTCVLLSSGYLDCWGYNEDGQLGNGGAWSTLPAEVVELSPPAVSTEPASAITQSSATLDATVNPEGREVTTCVFEYGPTKAYGSSVPCTQLTGSGSVSVAVSAKLAGLAANTEYHFRISATNAIGTSHGEDQTFTTLPTSLSPEAPLSPKAPSSSGAPVLGGSAIVGRRLVSSPGGWSGGPGSFVYRWQSCAAAGGGCVDIPGAAGAGYTVARAVLGRRLRALVTASNEAGSASAVSGVSQIVGGVVESRIIWAFRYTRRYTRVARLLLQRLPAGAGIEVRCNGIGCPFTRMRCSTAGCRPHELAKHRSEFSLAGLFTGRRLAPGSKITITITLPNWIARQFTFTTHAGTAPTVQPQCLPPGTTTPQTHC
jgi:hypothetical protein